MCKKLLIEKIEKENSSERGYIKSIRQNMVA
jgi:hypothetical protein